MDFLPPSLNSATIARFIAIILFSHYLLKRSRVSLAKIAPIAPGAWPVIGHLPLLLGTQPPHITLGAMADKYGALFTIKLGSYPTLVLSSSEIAKEFFTTNDLAVSLRPRQLATEHLGYDYAMFGFGPYGPYRRELRFYPASRLSAPRVFSENCIIALASFLHVYDISMPLDAKVDMTETTGLTNHKATPLEVLIKPRLHLPSFMD
nr:cytochrome p450 82a3 [Quercus suber]